MNKITRSLAIASVAGAALLGTVSMSSGTASAQEDQTTVEQDAPAPAPDDQAPEGCEHGPGRHRGPNLGVAAETIGIDVDELRQALHDGATIAEVAEANGVDPQTVIDAMISDVSEHLAAEVEDGTLTQEQADDRLAEASERIADVVENGRPERPEGQRPGGERPGDGTADETPES